MNRTRCRWCNPGNPVYVAYHDTEWGRPQYDDRKLFELLVLESFQAGLSWETILNKRKCFHLAFDGFDPDLVRFYSAEKVHALMDDPTIIRNRRKIDAAICNAAVFADIQKRWGSFSSYIWHFTEGKTVYEADRGCSPLSDSVCADLKKQGMKFIGTKIIYSYLQAIGVLNCHDRTCYLYRSE